MKKNEISAKFSGLVADAIAEGFYVSMNELTGSYSDVMGSQLVLAKGNERIIIWMEEHVSFGHRDEVASVTLYASRFALKADERIEWNYRWSTQWKEHIVWSETMYQVSEGRHNDDAWYTSDKNEAENARNKRYARWEASYYSTRKSFEVTDKLFRIVRRVNGFKTVKRDNVRVWKLGNVWNIENVASGNRVTLHA